MKLLVQSFKEKTFTGSHEHNIRNVSEGGAGGEKKKEKGILE